MDEQEKPKTADNNQIVDVAPAPVAEADDAPENTAEATTDTNESNLDSTDSKPETANDSPATTPNDGQLPAPGLPTGHKAGGPIVAIVAAIVVALGLAAVTVYAYMKMQNETKPATTQTETNTQTETPASEDVDNATKDVDDAINASDQSEFDETELSDESLGL